MANHYRALTRAYRPQAFEDIVSQEHVSNTLINAIKNNRLSHAYMFCGPRGVGKTTMARVLARTINEIDASVDGESLNQTLNVIEMDAASNNKVEDVHHLRESVRIPPQNGRYKVFIVDEVHMLSKSAFNALLKTLEEPPDHAIFIFATTEPHKVLPTILSRVQRFDFKRISVEEIVSRLKKISLKESIEIDNESLHIIAKKADGALRDALGLMDQAIAFCGTKIEQKDLLSALNIVGSDQLFMFTDAIADKKADAGLQLIHDMIQGGTDIQEFLVSLTEHFRNLYVAGKSRQLGLLEATAETKERYKVYADKFSEEDILRMLHMTSDAQERIRNAQQPKTHFEILLLKLVHMHRTRQLDELISRIQDLKKKQLNNPSPAESYSEEDKAVTSASQAKDPGEKRRNSQNGRGLPKPGKESDSVRSNGEVENSPESQNDPDKSEKNRDKSVENEDDLLGKPTLGYSGNRVEDRAGSREESVAVKNKQNSVVQDKRKKTDIHSVLEIWPQYLEDLQNRLSKTLYYQVQRIQVEDVKGRDLHISVDNELAFKIVTENQQELSRLLKQFLGTGLKFCCKVKRTEKKTESLSPYEEFVKLQKKDPKIKTIVDLFGAELEY
ncbi:MAG TPA: DNA polymerase III subunit gamma/tau [Balneolaceae bacterium]|nr:DNA polymerase III subunit gamma/tau [Balneolaceae bacterium]